MPKTKPRADEKFSNIFLKPEPAKVVLLADRIDDYLHETRNPKGDECVPTRRFRPSQLAKATCLRKMVYEYLGAEYEGNLGGFDAKTHRVFDNGHGVHERIQNYLADMHKWSGGEISLIGRWKCKSCGKLYGYHTVKQKPEDAWVPKPDKCKCGEEKRFRYMEIPAAIPDHLIEGASDGCLLISGEKFLLEIKSASNNVFSGLSGVPTYYKPQINLYMHGTGIFQTIFLFENKNTQELKEILYRYESSALTPIFKKTKAAAAFVKKKKMPPRFTNSQDVQAHCRLCEFRKICSTTDDFKEGIKLADYAKP